MGFDKWGKVAQFGAETLLEATAFTAYDSARGRNTNFFGNVADSAIGNVIGEGIGRGIGAGFRTVGRAIGDTRIGQAAAAAADSNFCRNSFSADTEVSTPSGDIPISEIEADDIVLAYNELTGEIGEYEVTHTISHTDEVIIHLYIDGELIETTPEHPFYNDSGEWIDAEDLEVGEEILSLDGDYGIVEKVVVIEDANQPMYNLTVDEAHTFFIGEGDWLVHNTNKPPFCQNPLDILNIGQPDAAGIQIGRQATPAEMVRLTNSFSDSSLPYGIEFSQVLVRPPIITEMQGQRYITGWSKQIQTWMYSGNAGSVPTPKHDWVLNLNHTHPHGRPIPSQADRGVVARHIRLAQKHQQLFGMSRNYGVLIPARGPFVGQEIRFGRGIKLAQDLQLHPSLTLTADKYGPEPWETWPALLKEWYGF